MSAATVSFGSPSESPEAHNSGLYPLKEPAPPHKGRRRRYERVIRRITISNTMATVSSMAPTSFLGTEVPAAD
jgi:hypothetical protein